MDCVNCFELSCDTAHHSKTIRYSEKTDNTAITRQIALTVCCANTFVLVQVAFVLLALQHVDKAGETAQTTFDCECNDVFAVHIRKASMLE